MNKKLAVISVIYENYDLLEDFLESLAKQANANFHLFVSDLSSVKKPIKENRFELTVLEG